MLSLIEYLTPLSVGLILCLGMNSFAGWRHRKEDERWREEFEREARLQERSVRRLYMGNDSSHVCPCKT